MRSPRTRPHPMWPSPPPPTSPTDSSVYARPLSHGGSFPSTSGHSAFVEEFRPVRILGAPTPQIPPQVFEKPFPISKRRRRSPLDRYADFLFEYPTLVLVLSLILFVALPASVLQLYPLKLDRNPEKGFDTRGTEYAATRLTWAQLQPFLTQGSRVVVQQPPPRPEPVTVINPVEIMEKRKLEGGVTSGNRTTRSLEDTLASLGSVACYEIELLHMDYMAQYVLEISSYEQLFELKTQREICGLQTALAHAMEPFAPFSPYRSIFHVPNYASCLSPANRDNCSSLSVEDLRHFRVQLESCFKHRRAIIACGRDCLGSHALEGGVAGGERSNCDACERVPANCTSQMWFDLLYRVLPQDLMTRKGSGEAVHVNGFLPFYTYSSYHFQGFDVPLQHFVAVEKALQKWADTTQRVRVKGYLLDIKRDVLFDWAIADSHLAVGSAVLIFALVYAYSLSLGYTVAVFVELGASVLVGMAVYRAFSDEFPLLNLVSFVLLLSIGSDGAFLLLNAFPERHDVLDEENFAECLRHTVLTMFLAQFSTIVPFLLNLVSSVIAFRAFGLFATLALTFNYLLLISFLPAFLVFQRRHVEPFLEEQCCSLSRRLSTSLRHPVAKLRHTVRRLLFDTLPVVLIDGRFVWLTGLGMLVVVGGYLALTQLHLPQYNPLQLFTPGNPHEWYDNHAERMFEFVSHKIALPLTVRLLFGFERVHSDSYFDPTRTSNVTQDRRFELKTVEDVRRLADDMLRFRMMDFVAAPGKFWPERFLDWSRASTCSPDITVCCNVDSKLYQDDFLDYCMRVSTSQIPTGYNDTPIYHNVSFDLVGYTALLPTKLRYSHRFQNLSTSFALFDHAFVSSFTDAMFYTTEWTLMSTWFDLQRSIIDNCLQSVGASFLVVLVFTGAVLRWRALAAITAMACIVTVTVGVVAALGWEVGVLEAVILVLVVSLSFDYTLHYGAAMPRSGCARHRIVVVVRRALTPVSMAAVSSLLAGAVMLGAHTHAFFQVATFLVITALVSWLFATFFFLPLAFLFLPKLALYCKECDREQQQLAQRRQAALGANVPLQVLRGRF